MEKIEGMCQWMHTTGAETLSSCDYSIMAEMLIQWNWYDCVQGSHVMTVNTNLIHYVRCVIVRLHSYHVTSYPVKTRSCIQLCHAVCVLGNHCPAVWKVIVRLLKVIMLAISFLSWVYLAQCNVWGLGWFHCVALCQLLAWAACGLLSHAQVLMPMSVTEVNMIMTILVHLLEVVHYWCAHSINSVLLS